MALYRIAGLTVRMEAGGQTARQAEPYRAAACPGPADLAVSCDPARVMAQNPWIQDLDTAEYMGTGADFARKILGFDGLQLHAAAVELEGRAWLFSGPSGVGKSTMAGRWERLLGARTLNDDKPALRRLEGGWTAYGTPWSGKTDRSRPAGAPLGGLAFLCRGEEYAALRLTPGEALPLLLSQLPLGLSRGRLERQLELADRLLRENRIWKLLCRNEDESALLAWEFMRK